MTFVVVWVLARTDKRSNFNWSSKAKGKPILDKMDGVLGAGVMVTLEWPPENYSHQRTAMRRPHKPCWRRGGVMLSQQSTTEHGSYKAATHTGLDRTLSESLTRVDPANIRYHKLWGLLDEAQMRLN
ncbi:hypothetical protein SKAU_G00361150 [Synaphobranchus kaupii]|uniref:Uncharacterized protein n=1 Tax=Synaphobranchus kaupii TaxID=118154 RepID=A0A9Q1IH48_SYNKA|nr:hypothetical protein SKAU_G00361150 [Synaphobranchus kaupii]